MFGGLSLLDPDAEPVFEEWTLSEGGTVSIVEPVDVESLKTVEALELGYPVMASDMDITDAVRSAGGGDSLNVSRTSDRDTLLIELRGNETSDLA